MPVRRDGGDGSAQRGIGVETAVDELFEYAVGLTHPHFEDDLGSVFDHPRHFEATEFGDQATVVIDGAGTGIADETGHRPYPTPEHGHLGDRRRRDGKQVAAIDGEHVDPQTERTTTAEPAGPPCQVPGDIGRKRGRRANRSRCLVARDRTGPNVRTACAGSSPSTSRYPRDSDESPGHARGFEAFDLAATGFSNQCPKLGLVQRCAIGHRKRQLSEAASGFGARLAAAAEATLEPLDATRRVDDAHLTGEERMAGRRDLDLRQRVGVAVFPLDGLVGLDRRARQEREFRTRVLEDDVSVVGMNVGLHNCSIVAGPDRSATA